MASKFIKYQDYDGNNIPDVCDDLVAMPAENTCLECKPNPSYVAPSWRDVPAKNPKCWYNEKNCKYQVAVSTKYTSLIPSPDASDAEADEQRYQRSDVEVQKDIKYIKETMNRVIKKYQGFLDKLNKIPMDVKDTDDEDLEFEFRSLFD